MWAAIRGGRALEIAWKPTPHDSTTSADITAAMKDGLSQSQAGKDPIALRRELLAHDPRALRVVNTAMEKVGWGTPLPAGRARGFAFVESYGSLCAQVAEVSMENGRPRGVLPVGARARRRRVSGPSPMRLCR